MKHNVGILTGQTIRRNYDELEIECSPTAVDRFRFVISDEADSLFITYQFFNFY